MKEINEVLNRLDRLERSVRRWKYAAATLGMGALGAVMLGQGSKSVPITSIIQEAMAEPRVAGVAPIMGAANTSQPRTVGLVRVWSDGSTEMLGGGLNFSVSDLFNNDTNHPDFLARGYDETLEVWWPNTSPRSNPRFVESLRWRPFIEDDLSQP